MDLIIKLGAVVGALATIYGFWKLLRGKTTLRARGTLSIFKPLPRTMDEMQTFWDKANALVQIQRQSTKAQHPDPIGEGTHELLCHIPQSIFGKFDPQSSHNYLSRGKLFENLYRWEFEIINAGQIEVGDLYLHLPFTGLYTVSNNQAEGLSELRGGKIHLGSLRSRDQVAVSVWSSDAYSAYEGRIYLTHSEGNVPVRIGRLVYATGLVNEKNWILWFAGIVLILLLTQAYFLGKASGERSGTTQPTTK